jgi:hypothetical protein
MTLVVEFQGVTASVAEHCRRLGLPANRIYKRMWQGWPIERALSVPIVPRASRKAEPAPDATAASDDGREFATAALVTVAEPEPPRPLARPFVARALPPKLDVQPISAVPALPRGTVAAVAEARALIQFLADLLDAPETLPLRRAALRSSCANWLQRFGGAA